MTRALVTQMLEGLESGLAYVENEANQLTTREYKAAIKAAREYLATEPSDKRAVECHEKMKNIKTWRERANERGIGSCEARDEELRELRHNLAGMQTQEVAPVARVKKLVNCAIIDSTGCAECWEDLPDGTPLFTRPAPPLAGERAELIEQQRYVQEHGANPAMRALAKASADMLEADAQQAKHDIKDLQANGKGPAPCARFCEANAFQIEIRRLTAEINVQQAKRVPMTGEEIAEIALDFCLPQSTRSFARAIEAHHGITPK